MKTDLLTDLLDLKARRVPAAVVTDLTGRRAMPADSRGARRGICC